MLSYREPHVVIDVKTRNGNLRLSDDMIFYIEVSNHDVFIHMGERVVKQWGSLSKYEEQLRSAHFARCNSCYLVNLKYVCGVRGDMVLVGEEELTISKPKRKEFLNALAQYKGGSR
jgi:DNA-binding LytR/AlgR family response regulator